MMDRFVSSVHWCWGLPCLLDVKHAQMMPTHVPKHSLHSCCFRLAIVRNNNLWRNAMHLDGAAKEVFQDCLRAPLGNALPNNDTALMHVPCHDGIELVPVLVCPVRAVQTNKVAAVCLQPTTHGANEPNE